MFASDLKLSAKKIRKIGLKLLTIMFIGFAACLVFYFGISANATEQKPKYWSTIMQENSIGHQNASNNALRGRVITFEPGAVARFHVHKAPGIRYILEGAVTVKRKDGTSMTYNAGSTFFEGPVGEKPARAHEVSNDGQVVAKIWLVELIAEADMKK